MTKLRLAMASLAVSAAVAGGGLEILTGSGDANGPMLDLMTI